MSARDGRKETLLSSSEAMEMLKLKRKKKNKFVYSCLVSNQVQSVIKHLLCSRLSAQQSDGTIFHSSSLPKSKESRGQDEP